MKPPNSHRHFTARILATAILPMAGWTQQAPSPEASRPPGPTCDQSLAQQIGVSGLNPAYESTYPLSSPVIPSMGFATADMSAAVDSAVGDFMNQNGMPGATVAMTWNNQLIFAKSYGYQDVDSADFIEPDSRLRIASISKAITAMGILQLVHDNPGIDPGSQLQSQPFLAPAFGKPIGGKLQSWIGPITVDELLHHAGGWWEDYEDYDTLTAVEALPSQSSAAPPDCQTLLRYVETRPMTSNDVPPGTQNIYSNIGFCALSEVIHELSGASSYFDYMQANVLNPLSMVDTRLGSTQKSKRQDREVVYYPCGYSPAEGPPAVGVPCAYSSSGTLVKGGPGIGGPSLFAPHDTVSPAYGGGVHTFSLEASEGAGGYVSTAIDIAHFAGAIASGKLPNLAAGPLDPGWPEQFYTYSTEVPSYETYSCDGWYGMGWDTVQPCAVAMPFLPWDNFNFIKGGGFPGTTSQVAATANGYSMAVIVNGDTGYDLDPLGAILWPVALPAAVSHAMIQPWTIDFSPQYAQAYSGWMTGGEFAIYLAEQKSLGLYPSRLEGRTETFLGVHPELVLEYRGRFGPLPAGTSGSSTPAPPQFMYGQSCSTVLSAIRGASASSPLVSLQKFTDPNNGANVYQAVWASPIPQLPPD